MDLNHEITSDCPDIITRQTWGARDPLPDIEPLNNPVTNVVVHHGASNFCFDQESCMKMVRSYQNLHLDDRKWFDIAYHYVIGEDGNIYEGRGWYKMGAHAKGFNQDSIGICIIGNFMERIPNDKAIKSLKDLIKFGVDKGHIKPDYILKGHRDVRNTLCPGDVFYEEIKKWPHFG